MGLLDSVVGMMGGAGQGGGGNAAMMNAVVSMLAGNGQGGGGLSDMLGRAQQGGLGDVVSSWIGSGKNLPISADQLQNLLGGDTLANLAQQLGMSQGDTAAQMSQMLPEMVDKLTPDGQMPQGGLGNVGDLLGALMRR